MRPAHYRTPSPLLLVLPLGAAACGAQIEPDYTGEPLATLRGSVTADQPAEAEVGVLWFASSPEDCGSDFGLVCSAPLAGGGEEGEASLDPDCQRACDDEHPACDAESNLAWSECNAACGWEARPRTSSLEICATSAVTDLVPVSGEFPASFQLDLRAVPPEEAILRDADGFGVAIGWFVALAPGADATIDLFSDEPPAAITGGAPQYLLVYADQDVAADSSWGQYLHGAYSKGYHVARVSIEVPSCDPDVEPECLDAESEIIVPAADDLDTSIALVLAPFESIEWPAFL